MEIDFYIGFEKRVNSTKRPSDSDVTARHTLTGHLKEPCSIMNPVINIQNPITENAPCVYTYAYIPRFYRYYFVKDWVWNDGLWTVQLEVDVLATYRNHIGESNAYIERASAAQLGTWYNGSIPDKLYPATTDFHVEDIVLDVPWSGWDVQDGCYVLGVLTQSSFITAGGAVQYYAMTQGEVSDLLRYLLSDAFFDNAGFPSISLTAQLTHDLSKAIVNPLQYIISCNWYPCVVSDLTYANSMRIKVGPWSDTPCVGCPILDHIGYRNRYVVTIPPHPQAETRGKYLNFSPYSRFLCTLPPFGTFTIDPSYIPENGQLCFWVSVDCISGKACLQVSQYDDVGGFYNYFIERNALFGVPIQLAQFATDYIGAISGAIGTVTSSVATVAATTVGAAAVGGLMTLKSVGNALESLQPQVTTEGVNGSFLAFERLYGSFPRLTCQYARVVEDDVVENGRPLCEVRRIDTLSGYIKCGECTIDFNAFESELNEVHSMLLNGFFWE